VNSFRFALRGTLASICFDRLKGYQQGPVGPSLKLKDFHVAGEKAGPQPEILQ
jgi:hypothetical protein